MPGRIENVVVVGGGSAGWLTAGVLAAGHPAAAGSPLRVTVLESPEVGTVGVGEGTWPSMRDTLRGMGVSETAFIRECDASFKQGSRFNGWVTGAADNYYYHPFAVPQGFGTVDLPGYWAGLDPGGARFADLASYQPRLCESGRAPKQFATPEFAAVANYAYHLDAGKFGNFLRAHCTGQLGVDHVVDHVREVRSAADGDIAALVTATGRVVEGDLFIDCTGFSSLLLGRHYGIPFVSRKDALFCDRALAVQVPYGGAGDPIAPHTLSTAHEAGWIWDIGLPSRRGVGLVYSSVHLDDDRAEERLTDYVAATGGSAAADAGAPRRIAYEPGHRAEFWYRNCVAVGISAGFIEPLEASALALIELSAAMIRDDFPATRGLMDVVARRYNERCRYRWDRIIEFLKLHYLLSRRSDSAFWDDNRRPESVPGRLREMLELWRYRAPSRRDFHEIEEIFPAASYQYVLYGMGFRPDGPALRRRPGDAARAEEAIRESAALARKYEAGLPTNRELVDHARTRGFPRI